ncbi:MAG: hypothetical protein V4506_07580 [Bacteroidota bacterium]
MKKTLLFFILLPVISFSQQSTIQEQSNHYKNYHFTRETQWDSLNSIEQGISVNPNSTALRSASTASCTLNKKV